VKQESKTKTRKKETSPQSASARVTGPVRFVFMAFSVLAEIGHSEQTGLFALPEQPDDKEATN
jgi:hypothetical protein